MLIAKCLPHVVLWAHANPARWALECELQHPYTPHALGASACILCKK